MIHEYGRIDKFDNLEGINEMIYKEAIYTSV